VAAAEGLYSVSVAAEHDGVIAITVADGVVLDAAGNGNVEGVFTIVSDRTSPTVAQFAPTTVIAPVTSGYTRLAEFDLQLQFSEPIADFDVMN
jgi:hypothetical protein